MDNIQQTQPAAVPAPKPTFWQSFLGFLHQYSVIGLAIGVVMGTAVNSLVQSIVQGLVLPLIGLIIPNEGFQKLVFHARGVDFKVGDVLSSLLQFVIIAFLIYVVVKKLLKQEQFLLKK
jgi:large conductance mechanosensitive channel